MLIHSHKRTGSMPRCVRGAIAMPEHHRDHGRRLPGNGASGHSHRPVEMQSHRGPFDKIPHLPICVTTITPVNQCCLASCKFEHHVGAHPMPSPRVGAPSSSSHRTPVATVTVVARPLTITMAVISETSPNQPPQRTKRSVHPPAIRPRRPTSRGVCRDGRRKSAADRGQQLWQQDRLGADGIKAGIHKRSQAASTQRSAKSSATRRE